MLPEAGDGARLAARRELTDDRAAKVRFAAAAVRDEVETAAGRQGRC